MKSFFISAFLLTCLITSQITAMPAQVIVIRHAEKPTLGNELSLKGRERAAALVPYLTETEILLTNSTPVAIYAMTAPKGDSSLRPIQTVTPLADHLKLTVKDKFERDNYKKMVEEIKSEPTYHGKTVLICWEHTLIPEISRTFGALQTPSRWPGEVFDRTWLITIAPNGRATFQNLPQRLMFGDSPN